MATLSSTTPVVEQLEPAERTEAARRPGSGRRRPAAARCRWWRWPCIPASGTGWRRRWRRCPTMMIASISHLYRLSAEMYRPHGMPGSGRGGAAPRLPSAPRSAWTLERRWRSGPPRGRLAGSGWGSSVRYSAQVARPAGGGLRSKGTECPRNAIGGPFTSAWSNRLIYNSLASVIYAHSTPKPMRRGINVAPLHRRCGYVGTVCTRAPEVEDRLSSRHLRGRLLANDRSPDPIDGVSVCRVQQPRQQRAQIRPTAIPSRSRPTSSRASGSWWWTTSGPCANPAPACSRWTAST